MPFLPLWWKKSLPVRFSTDLTNWKVPPFHPFLEELDRRDVPAVITVTSTADDVALDGMVTLREAILAASTNAAVNEAPAGSALVADDIEFNIPGAGPFTITLSSNLPTLSDNAGVFIDGYSQPGASSAGLLIEINGNNTATVGLDISATNNTIQGLVINGVNGVGINIGASANVVQGNYIGTDVTGTANIGNVSDGVFIGAANNTVGGTAAGERNIISGNGGDGIEISGASTSGNVVLGNYIGTDSTGTAPLGNAFDGVLITNGAGNNTVGAGNVISGNDDDGVQIDDGASGNVVVGSFIGTDASGTFALGNGYDGVYITSATDNTVGGTAVGAMNVISGNSFSGVEIDGAGTTGNVVTGNYIGTDVTGTFELGNFEDGVSITDTSGNTIGGTTPGSGNLISGNFQGVFLGGASGNAVLGNFIGTDVTGTEPLGNFLVGVLLIDAVNNTIGGAATGARNLISGNGGGLVITIGSADSTGNLVAGNFIGTDVTGTLALGNDDGGVSIAGASANTIGGTTAGAGNLISGNGCGCGFGDGVFLGGASGNVVLGNFIGTDVTGTVGLGNGAAGVALVDSVNNTIGGVATGARNVISGNGDGVVIDFDTTGSTGNMVLGNYIGTDATGMAPLGNVFGGVTIAGSFNNTIGGTTAAARNVISANGDDGVYLTDASTGNVILGNYIGTDASGTVGMGNGLDGVFLEAASTNNTIGGVAAGARNIISGNFESGVEITSGSSSNVVLGNFIGTDVNGSAAIGNGINGVFITLASSGNTVGGTAAGAGNVLAFNGQAGVVIGDSPADSATVENQVLGNSIFGNAGIGIDLGNDGPTPNGANPRAFPNNGQNFPVLIGVGTNGTTTTVLGSLTSRPNAIIRVEFFANPPGGEQGQTFLGFRNVTTNASGRATFQFVTGALPLGSSVTATATDDTSEFSAPATVAVSGGTIRGAVFEDSDGNGARGAGEPALGGVVVFIDANGDGVLNRGETQATTAANGTYTLNVPTDGFFQVRQIPPAGFRQTTANPPVGVVGGQTVTGVDFGDRRAGLLAVGAGAGGGGLVRVFDATTGAQYTTFAPYANYNGDVTVATGDVTGDGVEDIITGTGAGAVGHVKVFDGLTLAVVRSFLPFPGYVGPVSVAVGDINGDRRADIIVGTGSGSSHVKVFDGATNTLIRSFLAFGSFGGGVRVSAGDFNGDRLADILVVAGPGGGTHIKVFESQTLGLLASFFAYVNFPGGAYVAAGDLDRNGFAEIITGADAGAGPHVKVFSGFGGLRQSFLAFGGAGAGGVRVGFTDITPTGGTGLFLGVGVGGGSRVRLLDGRTLGIISDFFALPLNPSGVFVG